MQLLPPCPSRTQSHSEKHVTSPGAVSEPAEKAHLHREDSNSTLVDHSLSHTMSTLKKAVSKVHHTIHPHHRSSSQSRSSTPATPTNVLSPTHTTESPGSSIAFPSSATQSVTSPGGSGTHTPVDRDSSKSHIVFPNTAAQRQQGRSRSVDVKRSKSKSRGGSESNVPSPRRAQSRPARGGRGRERTLSFTEERAKRDAIKEEDNARQAEERKRKAKAAHDADPLKASYGDLPMNMSQERVDLKLERIEHALNKNIGDTIRFRARVHHLRAVGPKIVFIVFRQQSFTLQGVLTEEDGIASANMVRWAEGLGREAIVIVEGKVQAPPPDQHEVKSTIIHEREIKIYKLHVVAHPTQSLPFQVEDISKPASAYEEQGLHRVGERTRLDNRVLDLRSPASQAIFKIHAAICRLFRGYLDSNGFTEIQSSKFQEQTAESGAAVFKVDYFRKPVFLAQSPQLAKQMCIAADMERVYEIGPVFRAENSNTHRHLTEFIGLDMEMAFDSHYEEVLDMIDSMFLHIFKGLQTEYRTEIDSVRRSYPSEDLVFLDKTLRLNFEDGVKLLVDSGYKDEDGSTPSAYEDLSTRAEQRLGALVKEKYHTDYYILNKFPASARPFYTMRDPTNDKFSNSYDFFIRGEEILSGGQRIHDAALLEERMKESGIDPASMRDYLDGFRYGCPPHGGGGIGLERVVFLFLKLGNVRWASLIPRDPRSFIKPGQDLAEASAAAAMATIMHGPESTTFSGKVHGELPPLENLIAHYGDATNTSWVDPAWSVWRDKNTGAAVGYVPVNGFAVTFGNPLCEKKQIPQVCTSYLAFLEESNLKPVWACIDRETEAYLAEELGWSALIAVAEERINPSDTDPSRDKTVRRKIHRAEREGVKITEVDEFDEKLKAEVEQRCKDWSAGRKGTQVHLTGVRPFDDMAHRKYFLAREKSGRICAMVVLAQLSAVHGFQVKWALEFPDAPLGAIEYVIAHVIRKMGDAGVRSATFGAGATPEMTRVDNIGGFRVRTLEKAYNGISHTFNLGNKGDFRSKFGSHQEPLYICYPKGQLGIKGVQAIMGMLQMPK